MRVCCIRGAITVDKNEKELILADTKVMLEEIMNRNNLKEENIISIIFTATKDITKAYPAVSARELGIVNASLMCAQEMFVEGSLPMCIRAMVTVETELVQNQMKNVYLKEAKKLRPDLLD